MKTQIITVGFALAALAACSDGGETQPVDNTGGGGGEAQLTPQQFYEEFVHPELSESCAFCHKSDADCVPPFMAEDADESYQALHTRNDLVIHKGNSNLIHHGAHSGPALTVVQEELVSEWLDLEHPDPPEGISAIDAIKEFGDCMIIDDYLASGFDTVPLQQTANDGPCYSCHSTGEAGTWLGQNDQESFAKNAELPFIKRLVRPTFDENGNFLDLAASNRFVEKVKAPAQCGSVHPAASFDDLKIQAINEYVQLTKDRWLAGGCN